MYYFHPVIKNFYAIIRCLSVRITPLRCLLTPITRIPKKNNYYTQLVSTTNFGYAAQDTAIFCALQNFCLHNEGVHGASSTIFITIFLKDAFAKGEIVLGTKAEGYEVTSGFTERQPPSGYGFEIKVPVPAPSGRKYKFSAASEEERDEWVKVLDDIISMSLSAVDKEGEI